jgi:glycine betaine/proline transport system substrate-binding protein
MVAFWVWTRARRVLIGLVLALAAVVLAACGSSSSGSASATSASNSGASSSGGGVTIKASQFTWTAAELTDDVLAAIAKSHPGLGVNKFTTTTLDPAPAWAGAQRGDINLLTEVDWPNQQPLAQKAADKVPIVSTTYTGAVQGWFVPAYVVGSGGPAAGLRSITQLNKYKGVFGGKLYDGDPGWQSTKENVMRLKGYGVDYQDVASGETAMLAQLRRAYSLHQPILLYLWQPLWVFARYKLVQLSEPKPYSPACFTTGNGGCAMPAFSAKIAAAKSLQKQAPKFWAMLTHVRIPLPDMQEMLAKVNAGQSASAVAEQWVASHSAQINSWIS